VAPGHAPVGRTQHSNDGFLFIPPECGVEAVFSGRTSCQSAARARRKGDYADWMPRLFINEELDAQSDG